MIRNLSFIMIVVGAFIIGIGAYQYFETAQAQDKALTEAKKLLETSNGKSEMKDAINISHKEEATPLDFNPQKDETVGILSIPAIQSELPIVEGTDEDDLEKGVGHYSGTAYPSQNDQIVLSGHRDTVFRRMGELKLGDELIIQLPYGEFTYIIEDTKIVDANDRTIIKSTAPNEELVVTTCYPFSYIGNAPDRYIITAKPAQKQKRKRLDQP